MLKKIFCLLICLSMLCPYTVFAEEESIAEPSFAADEGEVEEGDYTDRTDVDIDEPQDTENIEKSSDVSSDITLDEEKNSVSVLSKYEKYSGLLVSLGIMEPSALKNNVAVTRQDFIGYISKFAEAAPSPKYKGYFSDVDSANELAKSIEFFVDTGVLAKSNEGKFNPNRYITIQEAEKILCCLAGYDQIANVKGGYPAGYDQVAAEIRLLKNVELKNDYIMTADVIMLLYNFLHVYMFDVTEFKAGNVVYDVSDETAMERFFQCRSLSGVVTANDLTALWSASSVSENSVEIEGEHEAIEALAGETDICSAIGEQVTVWYTYEDDIYTCVYYADVNNRTKKTVLLPDDIEKMTSDYVRYFDGKRNRDIKLSRLSAVIYNDAYYPGELSEELTDKKTGKIELIDNNDDGYIEVVRIKAYETMVVGAVYVDTDKFSDESKRIVISTDEELYDKITMHMSNGTNAVIQDINSGYVVSYAISDPASSVKVADIIISDKKISGSITRLDSDGGHYIVELDKSEQYRVIDSADRTKIRTGIEVTLYLDAFSNVAKFDCSNSGSFLFGIVIKYYLNDGADGLKIQAYTVNDELVVYDSADKITIDGTGYKDAQKAYDSLEEISSVSVNGVDMPESTFPARIRLNSKNQIVEIDSQRRGTNEKQNSLTLMGSGEHVWTGDQVLGAKIPLTNETTVLNFRTKNKSDIEPYRELSNYDTTSISMFANQSIYTYIAYKTTDEKKTADYVMVFSGYTQSHNDFFMVIKGINDAYNVRTDGITISVEGIMNGSERSVLVADEYVDAFKELGLECGETIRYLTNSYGEMISIDENKPISEFASGRTIRINNIRSGASSISDIRKKGYSTHLINGYVKSKTGNILEIYYIAPKTEIKSDIYGTLNEREIVVVQVPSGIPITVYDGKESKKVSVYGGSIDNIRDYDLYGTGCSRVLIRYRSDQIKEIVIYNNDYDFLAE